MSEPDPIALITIIISVVWTIVAISFIRVFNPSQTFLFGPHETVPKNHP
ncbi:MAG TPA: hypothetical protein VE955_00225 [Candidatus Dormibacteraeota bacterium]|nr:hypothetical protein [Candidatus Dormibacteraeota bacterium]